MCLRVSVCVRINRQNKTIKIKHINISGDRAMSPAQSEDSGLAADRGTTYATISLPRDNAQAMGIELLGKLLNLICCSDSTFIRKYIEFEYRCVMILNRHHIDFRSKGVFHSTLFCLQVWQIMAQVQENIIIIIYFVG